MNKVATKFLTSQEITPEQRAGIYSLFREPFGADISAFNFAVDTLSTHTVIHTVGRNMVAMALLTTYEDDLLISFIATASDAQRQGHASKLLHQIENIARANHLSKIIADVEPASDERAGARAFFRQAGFVASTYFGGRVEKHLHKS